PTGTYTCPSWTLGTVAGANTLKVTANNLDPAATGGSVTFTATGRTCPSVCITSFTPTSTNVILESADPAVNYNVTLHNSTASTQSLVIIQGYLIQGSVTKAAGGTGGCPASQAATIDPGDCT